MVARVDGVDVSVDVLWWRELNFNQFRWPGRVGTYELEIPRSDFLERLGPAYRECVAELQPDDPSAGDPESPLSIAGYPPLEELQAHPPALVEAVSGYLSDDLLAAFVPFVPSAAKFMVNSIDDVSASSTVVVIRGRGYHGAPGFGARPWWRFW
mgnify:CR=1 FL=1